MDLIGFGTGFRGVGREIVQSIKLVGLRLLSLIGPAVFGEARFLGTVTCVGCFDWMLHETQLRFAVSILLSRSEFAVVC